LILFATSCYFWCSNNGGEWKDNGNCYDSTSSTPKVTGCCRQYQGARKACFLASDSSNGDKKIVIKSKPCSSGPAVETQATKDNGNVVLYASMNSGVKRWGQGFEVSVRHKDDPFVTASRLTDGCSSGTKEVPSYTTGYSNTEQPTSKTCFGLTAGEIRSQAMILLAIGAIFSIFPCSVLFYLSKSKNNHAGNNSTSHTPHIFHPGNNQQQYSQQQKQFNQQPVQAQFIPQQQPVQAQYIPQQQPVQYIGSPEPMVVHQSGAQTYAQPVQPLVQPQYNQAQVVQPSQVQYVTK
jgi:hypothetical protein